MIVGVYSPGYLPASIRIYIKNIIGNLDRLKLVSFVSISDLNAIDKSADLLWYPSLAGGRCPALAIRKVKIPVVLTVHGAGNFTISSSELYGDWKKSWRGNAAKAVSVISWLCFLNTFRNNLSVITVSDYAKEELVKYLRIPPELITPVYHGFNPEIFKPVPWKRNDQPGYFFHVSDYQPKKNIPRIIEAYESISDSGKPSLCIVAPGISKPYSSGRIRIIDSHINHEQLAVYFQHALAFVFPSLHESFGLPIIEAMASGCPVITSENTACKEVAGNAALFVNPRSAGQIQSAMEMLINDSVLRNIMAMKGLINVRRFDWEQSALKHLEVFYKTIDSKTEYNIPQHEEISAHYNWNA